MDTTKCIDNSRWEAYSKGQLAAKELNSIQEHVQTCEICADIKEGIDLLKQPQMLVNHVEAIHLKVDKKVKPNKGRIIGIIAFVAAAAAIIAIANGFLFMAQEDAERHTVLQTPPAVVADSVQPDTQPVKALALEVPKLKKQKLPTPEQVQGNSDAKLTEDIAAPSMADDASVVVTEKEESDAVVEQKADATIEQVKALPQQSETLAKPKAKASSKQRNIFPAPANVTQNNAQNNYLYNLEAIPLSDSSKVANARALLSQKQFNASLSHIQTLAQDTISAYHLEAKYLAAQCFVGLNRNDAAVKYLKEIIKTQNPFADKAKELLDSLQKD